jgi:UDP-N-acetylmuramoyl-tripeptide--D-alanyl-D-alanine ligase
VKASGIVTDGSGCTALTVRFGARKFSLRVPIPGVHNAFNALAASAVGLSFGVPQGKISAALGTFEAVDKRMQVVRTNGMTIFNDAYNANPDSMLAALEALSACVARGKRIAVVGDMRELGSSSEDAHRAIGKALRGLHIDAVLAFGALSVHVVQTATIPVALHFERKDVLIQHLRSIIAPGDVILVKGSRSMQMEEVVTALTTSNSQAA